MAQTATIERERTVNRVRRHRRERRIVLLLTFWALLVTLYFLWEANSYRGLYALLAEWQFDTFGHYVPILTFALLVAVFGSPAMWLLRSRRRDFAVTDDAGSRDQAIAIGSGFRRVLFIFAGVFAAAALLTFLWTLTLPNMLTPTRTIVVGQPNSIAPARGPAFLRGQILYPKTSTYTQNLLFTRRGVRFAPVAAFGQTAPILRYFVELKPSDDAPSDTANASPPRDGILMRSDLPGSIVQLYRYAGYRVDNSYYVLYASTLTMCWPYYVSAVQLFLAALVALVCALLQHQHVRRSTEPDARQNAEQESDPALI